MALDPEFQKASHASLRTFYQEKEQRLLLRQVFELMRGLDKDCDSTIDLEEFASRFAPVFTRLNIKQDVRAPPMSPLYWWNLLIESVSEKVEVLAFEPHPLFSLHLLVISVCLNSRCMNPNIIQEEISKAIAGRRCSLVLSATQEQQMVELITKLLK